MRLKPPSDAVLQGIISVKVAAFYVAIAMKQQ
jgi:hypothetical protein